MSMSAGSSPNSCRRNNQVKKTSQQLFHMIETTTDITVKDNGTIHYIIYIIYMIHEMLLTLVGTL